MLNFIDSDKNPKKHPLNADAPAERFRRVCPGTSHNPCPAGGETAELFHKVYSQKVELPEELGGRVKVISCVSYGEKQQVYLVKDRKGRLLILKLAQGEKVSFLRRDASMLKQHSFSFLPHYVHYAEKETQGYLLREYIEGDTLWEWVNKRGTFEIREANEILCRLCGMVEQLHRQDPPVIHRDIKPQNIVLTEEKNLFMIDMGTVRKYKEFSNRDTNPIGSRLTAAPEQYGYSQTDERSDIYAFGVLYLFLLTGEMNAQGIRYRKDIPHAIRHIIEKCTRMDPDDRYQSCLELRWAIGALRGKRTPGKKRRMAKSAAFGMLFLNIVTFCAKVCLPHTKYDEK